MATKVVYFVRMRAKENHAEEVRELLLENFANVEKDPGNVTFAVHRSRDDSNEFWMYEVWESQEAVDTHESSTEFLDYRKRVRPLVDGESVVWGNTSLLAVAGYNDSP